MPTKEWGNATWLLFHTLAAQIDETKFAEFKNLLILIITTTCHNLPCPICTQDASNILKKANIHNINTKEDFIEFLRQFHNIVNIKLQQKTFSIEELKIYNKIHLINVINNFINLYIKPSGNMKMIINSFQRQNFINQITPKLKLIVKHCKNE